MKSIRSKANSSLVLSFIAILSLFSVSMFISAKSAGNEPTVIQAISPTYSPLALAAHVEGEVTVEAKIDPQGDVTSVKKIKGHPLLSPTAEKAASRWKFNLLEQTTKERTVQLYFKFTMVPINGVPDDIVTIFWPPYRVEVRDTPGRWSTR